MKRNRSPVTHGLTHLQIAVRDLETSNRFYRDVFGMRERFRVGTDMIMLETPGAHDIFTLNRAPARAKKAGTQGGIAHFGFRLRKAADLSPTLRTARARGGEVVARGKRGPDGCYAFVKDPDGYLVEIFFE